MRYMKFPPLGKGELSPSRRPLRMVTFVKQCLLLLVIKAIVSREVTMRKGPRDGESFRSFPLPIACPLLL